MSDHGCSDYNNLFPESDKTPDRDPEVEDLFDSAEILAEIELDEMVNSIETEMRDISGKFAFELLLTLMNPTLESRTKIVDGLVNMAAGRIESDFNKQVKAEELEVDEAKELNEQVNKAFSTAQKRFREDYENCFFDEAFLERCRKAVRKNLSR